MSHTLESPKEVCRECDVLPGEDCVTLCPLHAAAPALLATLRELSEALWSEPPIQTSPPGEAPAYRYVSDRLALAQENAQAAIAAANGG